MSRLWTLVFGVVFLAGCHNSAPMQNPFFGPTTVPPPPTGNTAAPMASPYYQSAPGMAPGAPIPSATLGPPPSTYPPAGATYPPQSSTPHPKAISPGQNQQGIGGTALSRGRWTTPAVPTTNQSSADAATVASAEPAVAGAGAVPSSDTIASVPEWSVVRVVERQDLESADAEVEQATSDVAAVATAEPRQIDLPKNMVEIGQLPPARTAQVTQASYTTSSQNAPRARSVYAVGQSAAPQASNDHAASDSVFGYDPQYRWLKGQLEYSEIERRWKLRYIPIDGATDDHGGSVLLPEGTELGDFRPGDYVTLYGEVGAHDENSKGYAPVYHADRIEPLER